MKQKFFWFYLLLLSWILTSCVNKEERIAIRLLDQAESVLKSDPQAAHVLLDSIKHPEILNSELNARWCMMSSFLADTIHTSLPYMDDLERAYHYLNEYGTPEEQAWVDFYYGRSLNEEKLSEPALKILLEAKEESLTINNYLLAGKISAYTGDIYRNQSDYILAKQKYMEAAAYFQKSGNKQHLASAFKNVAREYAALDSCELAMNYIQRAYVIIQQIGDSISLSNIYNNIGNIHLRQGNYNKAKLYYYKSILLDPNNSAPSYFALGRLYLKTDSLVQAEFCFNEAKKPTSNPYTHIELLYLFALLEECKGNNDLAVDYLKQYIDSSETDLLNIKQTNLAKTETLFDRNQMIRENSRLKKDQEKYRSLFVGITILCLLMIVFYQHRINRKNNRIIQQKDELSGTKNELLHQEFELNNLKTILLRKEKEHSKNAKFYELQSEELSILKSQYELKSKEVEALILQYEQQRSYILKNSSLYKKVSKLATTINSENKELLSEKDWISISKLLDTICPNLEEYLLSANITPTEKKYCYLSFFHLKAKEESIIMGVDVNTPNKMHTRIRKKLNISGSGMDFYNYFMNLI